MMTVAVIFSMLACLMLHQQVNAQFLDAECGRMDLGYTRTDPVLSPWMAYIYVEPNTFVCGGTLIHKSGLPRGVHYVAFSRVHLGGRGYQKSQDFGVSMVFRHRNYSPSERNNDIGMLRLDRSVVYDASIRPICIFTNSSDVPHVSHYRATGWENAENEEMARILMEVQPNDCSLHRCAQDLSPEQICAGNSKYNCMGDSGGPLFQEVTVGGGQRYVQFGIASKGNTECQNPRFYTRVSSYIDWVMKIINRYEN
ncbi:hypothetical protein KR009_004939 [Drosophila setifemur]|nr:hypothetical protein KR009_004939 [Drosophila setifemur]